MTPNPPDTATEPSAAEDAALAGVLDRCLADIEAGRPVDVDRLAAEHPALASRLRACLAGLQLVERQGRDLTAVPADGALPSLGDYRIVREVGRGGMGVVYEAEQVSLGRRVALKVLPFASTLDPRHLQRFKTEAHAAAGLHHTNIVPVFGVGSERGVHYYAMQFIDGRSLADLIAELRQRQHEPGRADPDRTTPETPTPAATDLVSSFVLRPSSFFQAVARLGVQAALALEHAHEFGIIHRDVKPANLLLDARGNLWVTDFGLAQCQGNAQLTLTGDVVGTLRYMAPEQALGRLGLVDHRADVYGLGATLYELLTLRPVVDGQTRQELLRRLAQDEPRRPRRINPAVPAELEVIVLKALARDPAERYQSARELADDLGRWLEHRPIVARRPTVWRRVVKWARRHRTVVAVAVGLLAVAAAALVVSTVLVWQAKEQAEAARDDLAVEKGRTEEALERARETSYRRAVALAERAFADGHVGTAEDLLAECEPGRRHWEWHYLNRLCRFGLLPGRPRVGVSTLHFSTDGRLLSTSASRTSLAVYDAAAGRVIVRIPFAGAAGVQTALSPDGKSLAAAGPQDGPSSGEVRLWEVATGKELHVLRGHTVQVSALAFSPDGRTLASAAVDRTLRVWDVAAGRLDRQWARTNGFARRLGFDGTGRRLVSANGGSIQVHDTVTGDRVLAHLLPGPLSLLAVHPDGDLAAVDGQDHRLRLVDLRAGKVLRELGGHTEQVRALAFSLDGLLLASGGTDQTVRLWETATGRPVRVFRGHSGDIHALCFGPGGRLASASFGGPLRVWDGAADQGPRVLGTAIASHGRVRSIVLSPDGRHLVRSGTGKTVEVLDAATGAVVWSRPGHATGVWCLALSPDGRRLATGGWDRAVLVWDAATGRELARLDAGAAQVRTVAFSPDGGWLAVAAEDKEEGDDQGSGVVTVWEAATGRRAFACERKGEGTTLAFTEDNRLLTTLGEEAVVMREAATGREVGRFAERIHRFSALAYHPGTRTLAVSVGTGYEVIGVAVWALDEAGGPRRRALLRTGWTAHALAFSPDGRRLVTAAADRALRFWDPRAGHEVLSLRPPPRQRAGPGLQSRRTPPVHRQLRHAPRLGRHTLSWALSLL